jgi:hypothetical protein
MDPLFIEWLETFSAEIFVLGLIGILAICATEILITYLHVKWSRKK